MYRAVTRNIEVTVTPKFLNDRSAPTPTARAPVPLA
jgi:hypothetical protein